MYAMLTAPVKPYGFRPAGAKSANNNREAEYVLSQILQ